MPDFLNGVYRVLLAKRTVLLNVLKSTAYRNLPSPVADFVLGISLGINTLKPNPRFNDVMLGVGLIHVIVVSGYNINLVYKLVSKFFRGRFGFISFFTAQILALIYAFVVGFTPPVVRAVISTSVHYLCKVYGYRSNSLLVLLFTVLLMIAFDKEYISNLSFQLSVLSSFGIIILADKVYTKVESIKLPNVILQDFAASLSAQIFTMPLIYHVFKRFNIFGIVSNPFLLWIIPPATMISLVYLISSLIIPFYNILLPYMYLLTYSFIFMSDIFHILFTQII